MMHTLLALFLAGCSVPDVYLPFDSDKDGLLDLDESDYGTDPALADTDGDNYIDGDEISQGTDPLNSDDHPYLGGWGIDRCRDDIIPTGDDVGQIADNFSLMDQFGETVRLWDFCARAVLLVSGAYW